LLGRVTSAPVVVFIAALTDKSPAIYY